MRGKLPAILLYTGDWLKDPALTFCSSSTRGIWIDLICAMHEMGREGVIEGSAEQLARVSRCTIPEFELAVKELNSTKTATVTDLNGKVTLVCRRMQREHKERKRTALRQKKFRNNNHSNGHVPPLEDENEDENTQKGSAEGKILPPQNPGPNGDLPYLKLLNAIGTVYGRTASVSYDYDTLRFGVELAKRPEIEAELKLLKEFKSSDPYFPQSMPRLLEKWDATLDRARNPRKLSISDITAKLKNLDTSIASHCVNPTSPRYVKDHSPEQRAQYGRLLEERKNLRIQLSEAKA